MAPVGPLSLCTSVGRCEPPRVTSLGAEPVPFPGGKKIPSLSLGIWEQVSQTGPSTALRGLQGSDQHLLVTWSLSTQSSSASACSPGDTIAFVVCKSTPLTPVGHHRSPLSEGCLRLLMPLACLPGEPCREKSWDAHPPYKGQHHAFLHCPRPRSPALTQAGKTSLSS